MSDRLSATPMPPELASLRSYAARRGLATPLLLLVASHRPLAFAAGQMLHLAAPLGALAGWTGLDGWAAALSDPAAAARLEAALRPTGQEETRAA
jgi:hypothetical protein